MELRVCRLPNLPPNPAFTFNLIRVLTVVTTSFLHSAQSQLVSSPQEPPNLRFQ